MRGERKSQKPKLSEHYKQKKSQFQICASFLAHAAVYYAPPAEPRQGEKQKKAQIPKDLRFETDFLQRSELFAFRDGACGAIVDASQAFDADIGIDHGDTVIVDFDRFGGATRFARTATDANFSINNRNCHFSSPKTAMGKSGFEFRPRRRRICMLRTANGRAAKKSAARSALLAHFGGVKKLILAVSRQPIVSGC